VSSAAAAAAAVLNKDADEEVATPGWKTFKYFYFYCSPKKVPRSSSGTKGLS
jgi:hypothetical protein